MQIIIPTITLHTQSRISQLLNGNTTHYSLERLMDIATQLGLTVRVSVTRPYTHT